MKTAPLLLRGGRILDPSGKLDLVGDILLEDGRIAAIDPRIELPKGSQVETVDATGCLVTAGWIDVHTHLREPGQTWKETIATGTASAAAGGFTSVACMANTVPTTDSAERVAWLVDRIAQTAKTRVHVIGSVSEGLLGQKLAPLAAMRKAGAVAFSDDGRTVEDADLLRRAMLEAKNLDVPILGHCEDCALKGSGVMNEGTTSFLLGARGIPSISEDRIVERDLALATETGCRYHVAHVSTAGSVALLAAAKKRGANVSGEATPHHLHLTDAVLVRIRSLGKVAPPLRTQEHVDALRRGVADGTVDVFATDHAPHAAWEKEEAPLARADFGMVGLETAFPLYLALVQDGVLPLERLVTAMTSRPADLLGLPHGRLKKGAAADVTVARLDEKWTVDRTKFHSKSRNTPFEGRPMTGRVHATVVGGRVAYRSEGGTP